MLAVRLTFYLKEEVPEGESGPYDQALAAYEREDPVRIYFEMDQDRDPGFHRTYASWPSDSVDTWRLYFQPDGSLGESPPDAKYAQDDTTTYDYEPITNPLRQLIPRNDAGQLQWPQQPEGTYASFVSEPLTEDRILLGSASVDLWLASSAPDTDIEVTLSEVRPNGTETYVQNGWLRASHREENDALGKPRRPWHTHRAADRAPLPDGEFSRMRVELFPFGHPFREGSRVKIAVETPGGNRPLWGFAVIPQAATNTVAHSASKPSSVALPLVSTDDVPTDYPACGSVRNQPCRQAPKFDG